MSFCAISGWPHEKRREQQEPRVERIRSIMSASMQHESSAEPNLTPILDMVFQLITFFMLVINFQSASLDLSLKLPVVGSARPVDTKGQEELLILNINSKGRLHVYGYEKDIESYVAAEAQASL